MKLKELIWIASSKKDLLKLPDEIRRTFGYGIYLAQLNEQAANVKALKGFGGAKVLEIIELDARGTYHAVYTIKMKDAVFVLHVFQKKSKEGIKTPKEDIELIKSGLKYAENLYKERFEQ